MSNANLEQEVAQWGQLVLKASDEIHRVVVGQEHMVTRLLVGLFTNGHVLIEGVPGLAKTLTVSTLAQVLKLSFQRIQFTPDLLPADLIGTLIYNPRDQQFEVKKGPIFAHIILADEINRSPAKVQSALLEAMQERQVTIGSETFRLDPPFLVLATQNPIEQEGTYPLPEAQVDRFMMKIYVRYPSKEEELKVMRLMARTERRAEVQPVLDRAQLLHIRQLIDRIELNPRLENYIVDLVCATRQPDAYGLPELLPYIQFGASPRASIALNLASRALAFLRGRAYVLPQDVKDIAPDVLNHRLILTYEAEADGQTSLGVVERLLQQIAI